MRGQRSGGDVLALRGAAAPPSPGCPRARAAFLLVAMAVGSSLGLTAVAHARSAHDFDVVRYVPPDSAAAVRGQEVALRFNLGRRFELTLQVNNAFAAQNRRAIARAEALIAAIPGVRRVTGPSALLTINLDARERASAAPLLAGGPSEEANEAVRQRLIRRSDAIGWFVSREGTEIRLLIDTDDLASIQGAIETTAASSGLVLLSGVAPASPLWPEPDRGPRPFPAWLPFLLMALVMLPGALAVAIGCRPTIPRGVLVTIASGVAGAAPAMLAPALGVRQVGLWLGCAAAVLMAIVITFFASWEAANRWGTGGERRRGGACGSRYPFSFPRRCW